MTDELHPWLSELVGLALPAHDYALFGSGPLLARGWISEAGDLDVIARGPAWTRACRLGTMVDDAEIGLSVIMIGDHITVGRRWGIGDVNIDHLIDTAEEIRGIPCVGLEHVIAYKQIADRPKDRLHLAVIAANADSAG